MHTPQTTSFLSLNQRVRLSAADRYVLVIIGELYLLIPQEEVRSVEVIHDLHVVQSNDGVVGWFTQGEQEIPVLCLSENLQLQTEIPQTHGYFIVLNLPEAMRAEMPTVGLTCHESDILNIHQTNLDFQPLPPIMKLANAPISQLVLYEERIALMCHSVDIVNFLQIQSEHLEHQLLTASEE